MKKLVLILILAFGFVSLGNAKQESKVPQSINKYYYIDPVCWEIADAIEAVHCGYVGCDDRYWVQVYLLCVNVN